MADHIELDKMERPNEQPLSGQERHEEARSSA
jgi:hypothetical protein